MFHSLCVHLDLDWVYQRGPLEFLDLARHCRREEVGVSLPWNNFKNLFNLCTKIHIKKPIGLIKDEELESLETEPLRILQMINEPPWSANNDMGLFREGN